MQRGRKIAKGDQATLKIGYLRSYSGNEFHRALALFSEKYPDVAVSVEYGNHEELYAMLRSEQADIILNDQRRAFRKNMSISFLTVCRSFIEVSAHSPLARQNVFRRPSLRIFPAFWWPVRLSGKRRGNIITMWWDFRRVSVCRKFGGSTSHGHRA